MAGFQFDASQVAPNERPGPVPAGDYVAVIDESEFKPTKKGDGNYLQLRFSIVQEGEFKGRKVFTRLNLNNPNTQAVEIAQGNLSAICHAVGVPQIQDTMQLHNIPMTIGVTLRPAHGSYEASNEIKSFKAATQSGTQPMQQAPAQQQQAPAQQQAPVQQQAPMQAPQGGQPAQQQAPAQEQAPQGGNTTSWA